MQYLSREKSGRWCLLVPFQFQLYSGLSFYNIQEVAVQKIKIEYKGVFSLPAQ